MHLLLDKIYGCLLGGMIGDAFGAPGEGLSYKGIQEKFGEEGIVDFKNYSEVLRFNIYFNLGELF